MLIGEVYPLKANNNSSITTGGRNKHTIRDANTDRIKKLFKKGPSSPPHLENTNNSSQSLSHLKREKSELIDLEMNISDPYVKKLYIIRRNLTNPRKKYSKNSTLRYFHRRSLPSTAIFYFNPFSFKDFNNSRKRRTKSLNLLYSDEFKDFYPSFLKFSSFNKYLPKNFSLSISENANFEIESGNVNDILNYILSYPQKSKK